MAFGWNYGFNYNIYFLTIGQKRGEYFRCRVFVHLLLLQGIMFYGRYCELEDLIKHLFQSLYFHFITFILIFKVGSFLLSDGKKPISGL